MKDISKTCCFTGHRPEKCKGSVSDVRARLEQEIRKAIADGYDTFISGMSPGVDTWAAEEVLKIRKENSTVRLLCYVPYKGVEKDWTPDAQAEFREILDRADEITYICSKHESWCFKATDTWMVEASSRVIAVFNGTSGGTEFTIRYATMMHRDVVIIEETPGQKTDKKPDDSP